LFDAVRGAATAVGGIFLGIQMPEHLTEPKDVCAVLVTFHPDSELPTRLGSITRQVGAVVMVDNGSADAELAMLRDSATDPAVELVLNSENLGLARALNIGMQHAAALGYSWVLLLDQDSRVDGDMVKTLMAVHESFPDKEHLAIIGSGFRERHRRSPKAVKLESCGNEWDEVDTIITSGSLLSLRAFSHVGPFREDFFIDYVDTEYCGRARANGYRVVKTRRPLMSHSIGKPTQHRLLWMKKWTSNHSADRRYYIARNHTVMVRESGRYPLGSWALVSFLGCMTAFKRITLYEQSKGSKIAAVFLGWWDGVQGHMGRRKRQDSITY
jgi:rhamnosyltransferase